MSIRSSILAQVVAVSLLVATAAHAQKEPVISDSARQHFQAGVSYLEDPSGSKYEEALQEFRKAYGESKASKILNNVGLCALNLERDGEAIEAYEAYLAGKSADITPEVRKQVERDIAMLKSSLVKVELSAEPADVSIVDERRNSKGDLVLNHYNLTGGSSKLGLHPGRHKVTVSAVGYKTATWEFDAEPGSNHKRSFKLEVEGTEATATPVAPTAATSMSTSEPPKASKSGIHPMVYVGGIAAGVFAAAATTTGVLALGKQSDFDKAKEDGNTSKMDTLEKSGKTLSLVTDIGIGAAVVSAGVATIFYVTSSGKSTEAVPAKSAFQVVPSVGLDRAGLSLLGSF